MSPDALATLREAHALATMTPGEAAKADRYDEYLEALKAGPAREAALLDHVRELECANDLATRRCEDWHAISQALALEKEVLLARVRAAENRWSQNARLREMWLAERAKRNGERHPDRLLMQSLCAELRDFSRFVYDMRDLGDVSQRLLMLSYAGSGPSKPKKRRHHEHK